MGVSSSEASIAWRMARTYSPEIVKLDRDSRIIWAQQMIETIQENLKIDQDDHKNECEECQRGELCFWRPSEMLERLDLISRLKVAISLERKDQEYADRARLHGVEYRRHVDGFCSYWQNLRQRKFLAVNYTCENCGSNKQPLECHHLHYRTLGFEELDDVRALCRDCHAMADHKRAYSKGLNTYASKKYGEHWEEDEDLRLIIEEEFDEWLELREYD
jgi:hypothetical protein